MLNLIQLFSKFLELRKERKLLNKPVRSALKFKKSYPNFIIGANCYGLPLIKHQHPEAILKIGAYCSFAKNVQIFLGGNHRTDWVTNYPFPAFFSEARYINEYFTSKGDVIIGSDVWLCENSTILSGVTIGPGAVIANGAIVTKDVAPYSIVGGNPTKHIKWRFDTSIREALLNTAWWDWPEDEILSIVDKLCSSDLADFIEYSKNRQVADSFKIHF